MTPQFFSISEALMEKCPCMHHYKNWFINMEEKPLEKFECGDCGCYFWVDDRNKFDCPNCAFQKGEDD